MSTSRRAAGALTIATAALALAACGSSSSDTLNKSDLAAKANAICKDYNAKSKAVPQATANDAAQIAAFYAAQQKIISAQIAKLKALKPADDVKDDWNAYLALNDQGMVQLNAIVAAANASDQAAYETASAKLKAFSPKVDAAADALGANICGSDSSS